MKSVKKYANNQDTYFYYDEWLMNDVWLCLFDKETPILQLKWI